MKSSTAPTILAINCLFDNNNNNNLFHPVDITRMYGTSHYS
jgi:hypothetical protein